MKSIIIIATMAIIGCTNASTGPEKVDSVAVIIGNDTTGIEKKDSEIFISMHLKYDSVKRANDSLYTALIITRDKYIRLKGYAKICVNNPKQIQFLKGWMNALDKQ